MKKAKIIEFQLLLKCFTWARFVNLIKVQLSQWFSHLFSRPIIWGSPWAISVEPTSHCNLKCVECPTGNGSIKRPHGFLSMDKFEKIIDKVCKKTFYLNLYFQGEPMLYPNIEEMILYAKAKKMFVFMSTNAHFLSQSPAQKIKNAKLDKLIISLDGFDQHSYQQYRVGGTFEKVMDGINEMVRAKGESKTPLIIAQILLLKSTENSLDTIKSLAIDAGVDEVEFKKAQFYAPNDANALLPSNPKYLRYLYNSENGWVLKNQQKKGCNRLWSSSVVTWNGDVLPCCYDKDADFAVGNILENDFEVLVKNEKTRNFRKNVLKSRKNYDICKNCGE